MAAHYADLGILGSVESSIRQAVTLGLVADADFDVDKATTLANIATRNAKLLAGQRADIYAQYLALVEAVKLGFNMLGATIMITDTAGIYAAIPSDWQPGYGVAI